MTASPATSGNLAYVIYTSGSTGRPKAVAIEHRSAVVLMLWSRREFSDAELSGVLASTSITFDMSVFELFAPLSWGGTVILAENALALPELPAASEVRVVDTVPSAMAELLRMGGVPPSVVTVNLGGEAIPRSLADRVYAQAGIERLYNVYGPSEDTTFSTWALVERESERAPSIGRPLDGSQAWVLDRHLSPAPVGVPGELYLGGEGVSRGYLGRPELTAERYVPDPFAVPGSRMYRVGDLVRYRPDGILEFLGRIDHQVKVRGFRVEPAEVESALLAHPAVRGAAVLPSGGALRAYLETAPGVVSAGELRQHLKSRLPEYMVPSAYTFLESLPLTPNGKVDRRALMVLPMEAAETGDGGAPQTPAEELVAGIFAEVLGLERVGVGRQLLRAGRPFAAGHAGGFADALRVRGGAAGAGRVRGADGGRPRGADRGTVRRSAAGDPPGVAAGPAGAVVRSGPALVPRPARAGQRAVQHSGRGPAYRRAGLCRVRRGVRRDRAPARGAAHDLPERSRGAGAGRRRALRDRSAGFPGDRSRERCPPRRARRRRSG